jgi:hypothetical protein
VLWEGRRIEAGTLIGQNGSGKKTLFASTGSRNPRKMLKIAAATIGSNRMFRGNDAPRDELGGCLRAERPDIIAKEFIMPNKLLAMAAIAGALAAPIAAQAQSEMKSDMTTGLVRSAPVAIDADGGIASDQRPAFRQYVIREHVPEYTVPERVEIGTLLPETGVTFYDVPQTFGVTPYRYTVVNGRTILVEPHARRIVQVID